MDQKLTQQYLKECLDYDPDTGIFTWKERPLEHFKVKYAHTRFINKVSGKTAGYLLNNKYWLITLDDKQHTAHRLAWLYMTGSWPLFEIDHKDNNRSNNSWSNLREATRSENQQNLKTAKSNSTTGYLGVSYNKRYNKYTARIQTDKVRLFLGYFISADLAYKAYLDSKRLLHSYGTL